MSLPEIHLGRVFHDAFRQFGGGRQRFIPDIGSIEVRYYPYAGLHHTIRVRSGRVYVRISDLLKGAPPEVVSALALLLVAKLLSRKAPVEPERTYRSFAFTSAVLRASDIARRQRGRKVVSGPIGRVYDLEQLFRKLNRRYFGDALPTPVLTWSRRRARSILGRHDRAHDTITISKALDSPDVPEWFVEYILFHEMLHIKHPAKIINGRRYYHTPAFRAEERSFPRYKQAQDWLDRVIRRRQELRARAA
jgi:hypothetical protein